MGELQWLLVTAAEVMGPGVTITRLKGRLRSLGASEVAARGYRSSTGGSAAGMHAVEPHPQVLKELGRHLLKLVPE